MTMEELAALLAEDTEQHSLAEVLHVNYSTNIRMNIGFPERLRSREIDVLALGARGYNALRHAGIATVDELIDTINDGRLLRLRNLGVKSVREIQTKLVQYGYDHLSPEKRRAFWLDVIRSNTNPQDRRNP